MKLGPPPLSVAHVTQIDLRQSKFTSIRNIVSKLGDPTSPIPLEKLLSFYSQIDDFIGDHANDEDSEDGLIFECLEAQVTILELAVNAKAKSLDDVLSKLCIWRKSRQDIGTETFGTTPSETVVCSAIGDLKTLLSSPTKL